MWENICRLCSSRGDYDIFAVIPTYLHENPNEFLIWQKPICTLLEETTGLTITTEDGLPDKMCAVCISYLKHAAIFRQQAIDNAISLKAVLLLNDKNDYNQSTSDGKNTKEDILNDKDSIMATANDLIFSDERKTDASRLINLLNNENSKTTKSEGCTKNFLLGNEKLENSSKEGTKDNRQNNVTQDTDDNEETLVLTSLRTLFYASNNKCSRKNKRQTNAQFTQKRSPIRNNLSAIFDGMSNEVSDLPGEEFQTASSDENDILDHKNNIFSYREKNFEEDDIMDIDIVKKNITINMPETCKERKCRACFRRFMFDDSFREHMDTCIEYKFLMFIEEVNRLLSIRRNKAISPHEFIRRMIFCIRKTCLWLKSTCGEILMADSLLSAESKKCSDSAEKNSTVEISSGGNSDEAEISGSRPNFTNFLCDLQPNFFLNPVIPSQLLNIFHVDDNFTKRPMDQGSIAIDESISKSFADNMTLNEFPKTKKFENILNVIDGSPSNVSFHNGLKKNMNGQNHNGTVVEESFRFPTKLKNVSLPQSYIDTEDHKQTNLKNIAFPIFDDRKMSARCNTCNMVFESVTGLEEHNANFHNKTATKIRTDRDQIIALFEDDTEPEMIVKKNNT